MAAGFGERQRAEEFARLLDRQAPSAQQDDTAPAAGVATLERPPAARDEEFAEMLRAVQAVIEHGRRHAPEVRPRFKEELGQRLRGEFAALYNADHRDGSGGEPAGRHRTSAAAWPVWRRRLIGGVVGVGVLSGGVGGVAWAASSALPGDPLYPVKRSLENIRVSVSGSDLQRGKQYLGQAGTRLDEIHHLLDRKDANVDGSETSHLIAGTMDLLYEDMDNAGKLLAPLAERGDPGALEAWKDFTTANEPQIRDLQTLLAPESQDKARRLVALIDSVNDQVAAVLAAQAHASQTRSGSGNGTSSPRRANATPQPSPGPTPVGGGEVAATSQDATRPGSGAEQNNPPPSPTTTPTLNVQVPIGSPATTVVVPPLLSGLPPIGITIGSSATGPTTDAGPPPTDPNPN